MIFKMLNNPLNRQFIMLSQIISFEFGLLASLQFTASYAYTYSNASAQFGPQLKLQTLVAVSNGRTQARVGDGKSERRTRQCTTQAALAAQHE